MQVKATAEDLIIDASKSRSCTYYTSAFTSILYYHSNNITVVHS